MAKREPSEVVSIVRVPRLFQIVYPRALWSLESKETDAIYLTFDDGPCPGVTDKVLDILQEGPFKATFFCIGKNVEAHPDLYQNIISKGHGVGNHSYSHKSGKGMSPESYVYDVNRCAAFVKSNLFRPPYGVMTMKQYRSLAEQYQIVMWNVISNDYAIKASAESCLNNVIKKMRPGSIVLMHDSKTAGPKTLEYLPRLLDEISSRGWKTKTLSSR